MYPQVVENRVNEVVESLNESGFLTENDVDEESAREVFGKIIFDRWKQGEELVMTEEEATNGLKDAIVTATFKSLMNKGLLDSIKDETGEDMFFLTDRGKEITENRFGGSKNNG